MISYCGNTVLLVLSTLSSTQPGFSGVFVARTKDVMDSAKEYKEKGSGSPIQQLSLVEIPIGKVNTLALSADNSTVAASVSGDIRFFSVDSLLSKVCFCSIYYTTLL